MPGLALSIFRRNAQAVCLALCSLSAAAMAPRPTPSSEVANFGSNPGELRMFAYVPRDLGPSRPLVVALHGCVQSAGAYDDETGWAALADQWRFALLLPQQTYANNSAACFNWFEPGDFAREGGEAMSIKQMIDKMRNDHRIDPKRIYVTGLSAGGAMTAVMLATYPEVFAAGAIVAGIPYRCAASQDETRACGVLDTSRVKTKTPAEWGDLVRDSPRGNGTTNSHAGPWPRVSIWQGGADGVVNPKNYTELVKQWTNVHGIDDVADDKDSVAGYPHEMHKDAAGRVLVEGYFIPGMDHGTPVDPGTGERKCGMSAPYILDKDICSSYYIGKFWGLDRAP